MFHFTSKQSKYGFIVKGEMKIVFKARVRQLAAIDANSLNDWLEACR